MSYRAAAEHPAVLQGDNLGQTLFGLKTVQKSKIFSFLSHETKKSSSSEQLELENKFLIDKWGLTIKKGTDLFPVHQST